MAFENDIRTVWEEEVNVNDRIFKLKYFRRREYDRMINYMTKIVNGIPDYDIEKRNEYYLKHGVIEAPYTKNGKSWKELSVNERFDILDSIPNTLSLTLINKLVEMNDGTELKKK